MSFYDDHAELYDIAFSWDVEPEVTWLLGRLGEGCRSLLEPGCGSGRMFPPFHARGIQVVGLDRSEAMLDLARRRLEGAGPPQPRVVQADITDFDLGERFDGAICPVNTFGCLLTREQAAAHLQCMARHLRPGARYLVQLDIRDPARFRPGVMEAGTAWEMERDGVRVRTTWSSRAYDPATGIETTASRFELLSGPEAGRVVEGEQRGRLWSWKDWESLVAGSPFRQVAAFDGNANGWPPLAVDGSLEGSPLTWHELECGRGAPGGDSHWSR